MKILKKKYKFATFKNNLKVKSLYKTTTSVHTNRNCPLLRQFFFFEKNKKRSTEWMTTLHLILSSFS